MNWTININIPEPPAGGSAPQKGVIEFKDLETKFSMRTEIEAIDQIDESINRAMDTIKSILSGFNFAK